MMVVRESSINEIYISLTCIVTGEFCSNGDENLQQ